MPVYQALKQIECHETAFYGDLTPGMRIDALVLPHLKKYQR
jgi:hypothetical protein